MQPICELENITKRYGNHVVLNKISLTVNVGEMVAIIGRSGSGKTTILNIIGMLENPDEGTVKLFGENRPRGRSRKINQLLRTRVSYLFQNFALIDNATVDENLEIPLIYSKKSKKEKQAAKAEALQRVGLNISLKQKIHELSGGEQQRVAIARILLKPCDLILADEPTGSLDAANRDEILKILKTLNQESKTIIIVTHDPAVAETCHRSIHLT
ncbi:ABC transporter ATP-binding protein [Melghirimyces algeriensis]|uniref:Putative ABC transport system ATP-binding protein n=1 Tax=Melghirimyces algeriensis TaxID=910412 RepID=A0A521BEY0_9BACL|nr:ABC transporter ATP-binding protein [Melghirimyces algeriensis]SMO45632.1 putative ABC transport system ATP-binding protein [Melghirimyces algeriensis]